jgi:hypothetical protein
MSELRHYQRKRSPNLNYVYVIHNIRSLNRIKVNNINTEGSNPWMILKKHYEI